MGMFAGASNADDRFCLEGNIEAVFAEDFTDDDAGFEFIVSRLQRIHGEEPVKFELFADIDGMSQIVDLRFNTADFFMSHFYMHAASIQFFDGFFHRSSDVAAHSLPVLFLQPLRNGQVLYRFCFARCLDPEFQFRADGEFDILDLIDRQIFHAFDRLAACQEAFQLLSDESAGFFQDRTGVDEFAIVQKEAWDAERADRTAIAVQVVFIVVDVPVHAGICDHVDTGIIQCGDVHQNDRGAVGLYGCAGEEIIVVFQEQFDRHLFIGVIAGQIDADQRNEADFRMGLEESQDAFFAKFTGRDVVQ
ncbi:Uncharacterised protein [Bacteroides xylanisolvens]|nr:Uncharacterised protein [Bacteroides xylanisolvens]